MNFESSVNQHTALQLMADKFTATISIRCHLESLQKLTSALLYPKLQKSAKHPQHCGIGSPETDLPTTELPTSLRISDWFSASNTSRSRDINNPAIYFRYKQEVVSKLF